MLRTSAVRSSQIIRQAARRRVVDLSKQQQQQQQQQSKQYESLSAALQSWWTCGGGGGSSSSGKDGNASKKSHTGVTGNMSMLQYKQRLYTHHPPYASESNNTESDVWKSFLTGSSNTVVDSGCHANYSVVDINGVSVPVPPVMVDDLMTVDAMNTLAVLTESMSRYDYPTTRGNIHANSMQRMFFSTNPKLSTDDNDLDNNSSSSAQEHRRSTYIPPTNIGTTKIPTPPSAPPIQENALETLRQTTPKSIVRKGMDLTISVMQRLFVVLWQLPGHTYYYVTHPKERTERIAGLKQLARDEAHHYWVGTKLLWADIQTARNLLKKTLTGTALTRRERKQLLRTVSDLFRLVPFSMFILIPFMEFALPFALRIFPNLLPSTFQDSLKAEESMKRELQTRIAMAQFFQETLEQLAKEQKRKAADRKQELEDAGVDLKTEGVDTIDNQENSAAKLLQFLEKARNGEMIPPDIIIRYANYFHDDLTLSNMPRMQLVNMCRYMSIPPYGADAFLRFQLRHRIRVLKEDDQRILWEGIDSLTKMELREACQERGMRSTGLSKDAYKRSLQQWLDLSVNKNVPISLLIMSRTFFLRDEMFEKKSEDESKSLAGLVDAISGLDRDVVNEVILEVATSLEQSSNPDIKKIKLEVLSQQNEMIRKEEEDAKEAAAKRKESQEKRQETAGGSESLESSKAAKTEDSKSGTSEASDESSQTKAQDDSKTDDEDRGLSTREMDAISQLLAQDPVMKERAELAKIKAAMKGDNEVEGDKSESSSEKDDGTIFTDKDDEITGVSPDTNDNYSFTNDLSEIQSNKGELTFDDGTSMLEQPLESNPDDSESDDPVVARLKRRLESMVDKIEVQLSDVQVKIGDKLHYLDKDRDGILSREEMALCLQQVLKRKISFEEAMEIAAEVDHNHDGVFTVDELIQWIDKHKLVKFVEEGRDEELNEILQSHSSDQKDESNPNVDSK